MTLYEVVPKLRLSSGYEMPQFGLGSWLSKPGEVGQAVRHGLDLGYRHFDCAFLYFNQDEIGTVLKEYLDEVKVKRKDLFITSKIWNSYLSYDRAKGLIDENLKQLKLDYLDLCLIHWPMGYAEGGDHFPKDSNGNIVWSTVDFMETYRALEDAMTAGKVRSIGVSNFNQRQMQKVLDNCKIKPAINQIECHPYFARQRLVKFCNDHGVLITCYSPLGNPDPAVRCLLESAPETQPNIFKDPVILKIAENHKKTPAQIALRWGLQRGTIIIPKSVRAERVKENSEIFDFKLSESEMEAINKVDLGFHVVPDHDLNVKNHPEYPFKHLKEDEYPVK